jgi:hypothetical protein
VDAAHKWAEETSRVKLVGGWQNIVIVLLSIAAAGNIGLSIYDHHADRKSSQVVVEIDSEGHATAEVEGVSSYAPRSQDVRQFLTDFCHDYFNRDRLTIAHDQGGIDDALLFMDPQLASATSANWKDTDLVHKFLSDPAQPEICARVSTIRGQPLSAKPPWQAWVDVDEYPQVQANSAPVRVTLWVEFDGPHPVPRDPEMLATNPMGWEIHKLQVTPR